MNLIPLPAFNDNYIWIIKEKDSSSIWAVDPGDAEIVIQYCYTHNTSLVGILITHHHRDHTGGVAKLKEQFQCPVYGPGHLKEVSHPLTHDDVVNVFDLTFNVIATPGHTLDHLCYYTDYPQPLLLCGDTLFRGGCGRIMEGSPKLMLEAMEKLAALPDETLVYCTHEYTLANYRFALHVDPDNKPLIQAIEECQEMRKRDQVTLPSSIKLEKATNPFLRTQHFALVKRAAKQLKEAPAQDPVNAFGQVRRAKDSF